MVFIKNHNVGSFRFTAKRNAVLNRHSVVRILKFFVQFYQIQLSNGFFGRHFNFFLANKANGVIPRFIFLFCQTLFKKLYLLGAKLGQLVVRILENF